MKKTCIIVVPLYHFDLYDYEIMSLKQLFSFYYNKYDDIDIAFCYPCDKDVYQLEQYVDIDWSIILKNPTHPYWFESHMTYNQLCLQSGFYSPWINDYEYEYMLIYQLDAFIFKDELHYWCNKNYDYIGGIDSDLYMNNKLFNGGFSLRKLSTFMELTKKDYSYLSDGEDYIISNELYSNGCNILLEDYIKFAINVYSLGGNGYYLLFNIISPDVPFGCHAFNRSKKITQICKERINYIE